MIHANFTPPAAPRRNPAQEWQQYKAMRMAQDRRNEVADMYEKQAAAQRAAQLQAQGGRDWLCERCGV